MALTAAPVTLGRPGTGDVGADGPVSQLTLLERHLAAVVGELVPEQLTRHGAARLVDVLSRVVNLAEVARARCARRATAAKVHLEEGVRSPAAWLAEKSGGRVGEAIAALQGAEAAAAHPGVAEALNSGEVSLDKAALLGEAAAEGIEPGRELLELARTADLRALRQRLEAERAERSSEEDLEARHGRLRSRRSLRTWTAADGAIAGSFRLAPSDAAGLLARLEVLRNDLFEEARRRGSRESLEAYAADALCALGGSEQGGSGPVAVPTRLPKARVVLRVDVTALRRGGRVGDEVCDIAGVGPVPLSTARELLGDAVVDLVIRKGVEVLSVTGLGRTVPSAVRTALIDRDPTCVVPGCGASQHLEIDHWQVDYHLNGPTRLDNLARLCRFHHRMKTHRGWRLAGGPGRWRWVAPGTLEDEPG